MKKTAYFVVLKSIRDAISGIQQANFDLQFAIKAKNPSIALMLSLFLGALGIDRFYVGYIKLGLLKLFTLIALTLGTIINWCLIVDGLETYSIFLGLLKFCFVIWVIIDWFMIIGAVRSTNINMAKEIQDCLGTFQKNTVNTASVIIQTDGNNAYTNSPISQPVKRASIKKRMVVSIVIFVTIFIFCMTREEDKGQNITASSHHGSKGYSLTAKEKRVLNILLKDEVMMFASDADTILKTELISSSASQIAQAYNENQVAADQRFFKKTLFISGRIQSINSGIGNEPYLSLYGVNEFLLPQAHFENGNMQKIAALKKGQKIYLVCIGNGAIIGTPMFNHCKFAINYAENKASLIKSEISDFLSGNEAKSKAVAPLAFFVIVETRMLSDNSSCFIGDEKKCLVEIRALNDKKINGKPVFAQKAAEVANELKALGIQLRRGDFASVDSSPSK